VGQPLSEQRLHWPAFIDKDPHIALGFSQFQALCQPQKGMFGIT